jgi:polyphosphate glucokinase
VNVQGFPRGARVNVLVIDVGGTRVKLKASGANQERRFHSGPDLTPAALVEQVRALAREWPYDAIALGYPGAVDENGPTAEPGNLGPGWVGFDFRAAFGVEVRVVNDAVMQALGAYEGGRMLFLGLGTGLGSALITEHVVIPLELGCLPHVHGGTIVQQLGRAGLQAHGNAAWQQAVRSITPILREALAADYVVLGGGNAKDVDPLPPATRRGINADAFRGGFRLWEDVIEPHDRKPPPVWRVVR